MPQSCSSAGGEAGRWTGTDSLGAAEAASGVGTCAAGRRTRGAGATRTGGGGARRTGSILAGSTGCVVSGGPGTLKGAPTDRSLAPEAGGGTDDGVSVAAVVPAPTAGTGGSSAPVGGASTVVGCGTAT